MLRLGSTLILCTMACAQAKAPPQSIVYQQLFDIPQFGAITDIQAGTGEQRVYVATFRAILVVDRSGSVIDTRPLDRVADIGAPRGCHKFVTHPQSPIPVLMTFGESSRTTFTMFDLNGQARWSHSLGREGECRLVLPITINDAPHVLVHKTLDKHSTVLDWHGATVERRPQDHLNTPEAMCMMYGGTSAWCQMAAGSRGSVLLYGKAGTVIGQAPVEGIRFVNHVSELVGGDGDAIELLVRGTTEGREQAWILLIAKRAHNVDALEFVQRATRGPGDLERLQGRQRGEIVTSRGGTPVNIKLDWIGDVRHHGRGLRAHTLQGDLVAEGVIPMSTLAEPSLEKGCVELITSDTAHQVWVSWGSALWRSTLDGSEGW